MDGKIGDNLTSSLFGSTVHYIRKCMFRVLSVGPIPTHIAFILDGNRRYAKKWNLKEGMGHRAGFLALMSMMKYCYELGVKYVTIYAFSIDNFKRHPHEVQVVMDLMLEKIEGMLTEESIVNQYGVRVYFVGNLNLLSDPVRVAAEKAMRATSSNNRSILIICIAYTSTDEIMHAAKESCKEKCRGSRNGKENHLVLDGGGSGSGSGSSSMMIKLADVERHIYMGVVAPDPEILIRTSGETRLSNFLLWQTTNCLLYSPKALWPEIGLRHLVWPILNYQRLCPYIQRKIRKQP